MSLRLAVLVALLFPFFVFAQSVQYSNTFPTLIQFPSGTYQGAKCLPVVNNGIANVQYNVRAVDVGTGASLCNTTVPRGTRVRFEFLPHTSDDISWFTTGYYSDSPYGDWIPNAASPGAANICQSKNFINQGYVTANTYVSWYGSLSVNPPARSISGLAGFSGCTDPDEDGAVTCAAAQDGTQRAAFDFSPTFGRFYITYYQGACTPSEPSRMGVSSSVYWPQDGTGWRYCSGDNIDPYDFQVPAQSIPCSVTVVNPSGNAPSSPSVSGMTAVGGTSRCVVGSPYEIRIVATDADGDTIRYGIDWDSNGTIDQFAPASGYVPSGTPLTVSRTYSTAGSKSVRVITMDSRGLTSGWIAHSFSCAATPAVASQQNESGDPGPSSGGGEANTSLSLQIRAVPSLLRSGNTSRISWSATNAVSCDVRGTNGDGAGDEWRTTISAVGGVETSEITSQTIYTLSCVGTNDRTLTQAATVNVVPTFNEQ